MESLSRGFKGLVAFNHPLAPHTSYGVGGPARIYAEPTDLEEMIRSLSFAEKGGLDLFVIGKGSNLLVSDRGFPGMVLNLRRCCGKLEKEGKRISVGAGYSLDDLTAFCARENLGGLEMLAGIPGTLGGALRMNAGAFDGAIYDRVLTVEVLKENRPVAIPKESLQIGYRKVPELEGKIILGCTIELEEASGIREKRLDIL
ncbi:MAG TPA: FAD-binding protein, partial [Chroococcales cyanobacterium]